MSNLRRRGLIACAWAFAELTSLYGQATPTAAGPGGYLALGGGVSRFQIDYGRQILGGNVVYADVNPYWRIGFEGEARYLKYGAFEQVTQTDYLGGVRLQLLQPRRFQPYVKALAGRGSISLPFGYAHGAFFVYAPGAGLDLALSERFTLRVIDVEYQHWPAFTFGALSPYGTTAGISFRLNAVPHFPKSRMVAR